MSRKQKVLTALIVLIAAAAAGAWLYFSGSTERQSTNEPQTSAQTQTQEHSQTQPAVEKEQSTVKTTVSATRRDTTAQVTDYELPLTVKEAMDALQTHYGKEYEINSTVEENGLNYFAVNYEGEKFASVAVDLNTGKAAETITETGAKTEFSLV